MYIRINYLLKSVLECDNKKAREGSVCTEIFHVSHTWKYNILS